MLYKKIITHAGIFHADELLAIATVILSGRFAGEFSDIIRKFKIEEEEYNDEETLILDVGGRYQPEFGNFDHHQAKELPATNMLILQHIGHSVQDYLIKHLYQTVSDTDTGIIPNGGAPTSFSAIVRHMNNSVDFYAALDLVLGILACYVNTALAAKEQEYRWCGLARTCNNKVAIDDTTQQIPNWKELAEQTGELLLATPNARGGFQLISRDSTTLEIPEHITQTFRHNSGFLAVYPTKELALNHAEAFLA